VITALIDPYWDTVTITAFVSAIIVLGLYLSCSAGAMSVAHAALAGMGGYLGAVLTTNFNWPFPIAIALGGVLAAIIGVMLALVTLRMNELVAGLTTLAFGETMVVIAYNIHYIGGASSFYGIAPDTTLLVATVTLLVALFVGWAFDRSRLGFAARAVRDNAVAAKAMGINVVWTKVAVFSLGAGLAGVGGVLQVHYVLVVRPSDLGFVNAIPLVIIWVVGGSYIFVGPVVGALALTFLPELLRFSNQERYMVYGLLLTVMVILRPEGIVARVPTGRKPNLLESALRTVHQVRRKGGALETPAPPRG
jgi:branched-chain amino acid transport system permease protein